MALRSETDQRTRERPAGSFGAPDRRLATSTYGPHACSIGRPYAVNAAHRDELARDLQMGWSVVDAERDSLRAADTFPARRPCGDGRMLHATRLAPAGSPHAGE